MAALYLQGNPAATAQQVCDALFNLTTNIVTNAQSTNNHLLFSNL